MFLEVVISTDAYQIWQASPDPSCSSLRNKIQVYDIGIEQSIPYYPSRGYQFFHQMTVLTYRGKGGAPPNRPKPSSRSLKSATTTARVTPSGPLLAHSSTRSPTSKQNIFTSDVQPDQLSTYQKKEPVFKERLEQIRETLRRQQKLNIMAALREKTLMEIERLPIETKEEMERRRTLTAMEEYLLQENSWEETKEAMLEYYTHLSKKQLVETLRVFYKVQCSAKNLSCNQLKDPPDDLAWFTSN